MILKQICFHVFGLHFLFLHSWGNILIVDVHNGTPISADEKSEVPPPTNHSFSLSLSWLSSPVLYFLIGMLQTVDLCNLAVSITDLCCFSASFTSINILLNFTFLSPVKQLPVTNSGPFICFKYLKVLWERIQLCLNWNCDKLYQLSTNSLRACFKPTG